MHETASGDLPRPSRSMCRSSKRERLQECYLLLSNIARDSRPIVGGYRDMARDILVRHGVTSGAEQR
jgi:hypothetical protein